MVESFNVAEAIEAAEAEYSAFPFEMPDGRRFELPNPYLLSPAQLRAQLGQPKDFDLEQADGPTLLNALVPGAWAAIQELPAVVQNRLIEAWAAHCGIQVDEAGNASSPSSPRNRAERRSKRISPSEAKTSGTRHSGS